MDEVCSGMTDFVRFSYRFFSSSFFWFSSLVSHVLDFSPFVGLLSPLCGCSLLFSAVLGLCGAVNLVGVGCNLWTEYPPDWFLDSLFRDRVSS